MCVINVANAVSCFFHRLQITKCNAAAPPSAARISKFQIIGSHGKSKELLSQMLLMAFFLLLIVIAGFLRYIQLDSCTASLIEQRW